MKAKLFKACLALFGANALLFCVFFFDLDGISPSPLAWRPDFPGAPREAH